MTGTILRARWLRESNVNVEFSSLSFNLNRRNIRVPEHSIGRIVLVFLPKVLRMEIVKGS